MINHENTPLMNHQPIFPRYSVRWMASPSILGIEVVVNHIEEYLLSTFLYMSCVFVYQISNFTIYYICTWTDKNRNEHSQVLQKLGQFVQFTHEVWPVVSQLHCWQCAIRICKHIPIQFYQRKIVFHSKPQKKGNGLPSGKPCWTVA